jgi:hypothetical protein
MTVREVLHRAYLAARGTKHLRDPQFTRSQLYWKGRADAANDVRALLREFEQEFGRARDDPKSKKVGKP